MLLQMLSPMQMMSFRTMFLTNWSDTQRKSMLLALKMVEDLVARVAIRIRQVLFYRYGVHLSMFGFILQR